MDTLIRVLKRHPQVSAIISRKSEPQRTNQHQVVGSGSQSNVLNLSRSSDKKNLGTSQLSNNPKPSGPSVAVPVITSMLQMGLKRKRTHL